jgi:hypothetical protein
VVDRGHVLGADPPRWRLLPDHRQQCAQPVQLQGRADAQRGGGQRFVEIPAIHPAHRPFLDARCWRTREVQHGNRNTQRGDHPDHMCELVQPPQVLFNGGHRVLAQAHQQRELLLAHPAAIRAYLAEHRPEVVSTHRVPHGRAVVEIRRNRGCETWCGHPLAGPTQPSPPSTPGTRCSATPHVRHQRRPLFTITIRIPLGRALGAAKSTPTMNRSCKVRLPRIVRARHCPRHTVGNSRLSNADHDRGAGDPRRQRQIIKLMNTGHDRAGIRRRCLDTPAEIAAATPDPAGDD